MSIISFKEPTPSKFEEAEVARTGGSEVVCRQWSSSVAIHRGAERELKVRTKAGRVET